MANASRLRAIWSGQGTAFGIWAALPTGFAVELMAVPGVDYICVDQQHGVVDYAQMVEMLRGIEGRDCVALTRVPANQAWLIGKALDAGAQGVVVPLVNTPEEAAAAVAACRYPPSGTRSFGPVRATVAMGTSDPKVLSEEVICFVMIETREGLENAERIAAVPGLDGIYIGPADLALGLGLAPSLDKDEPEHVAAVERIRLACAGAGIVAGIQCGSGASARAHADRGFGMVTFTKDSSLLQSAAQKELAAARGDSAGDRPAAYA